MAIPKAHVLVDKNIHSQLKAKLRASGLEITLVINRLVEMYLKGEVKVIIPAKRI